MCEFFLQRDVSSSFAKANKLFFQKGDLLQYIIHDKSSNFEAHKLFDMQ